jgi:DNA-binding transcriptional regulator YdaS (Cro superfamily)
MSDWRALLEQAVKASNRAAVARVLGVSRAAVSTLLSGRYQGQTTRMAARVIAAFGDGSVHCPHLDAPLRVPECRAWFTREQPTSQAAAMKHWLACRTCPIGQALHKKPKSEPGSPTEDPCSNAT